MKCLLSHGAGGRRVWGMDGLAPTDGGMAVCALHCLSTGGVGGAMVRLFEIRVPDIQAAGADGGSYNTRSTLWRKFQ